MPRTLAPIGRGSSISREDFARCGRLDRRGIQKSRGIGDRGTKLIDRRGHDAGEIKPHGRRGVFGIGIVQGVDQVAEPGRRVRVGTLKRSISQPAFASPSKASIRGFLSEPEKDATASANSRILAS